MKRLTLLLLIVLNTIIVQAQTKYAHVEFTKVQILSQDYKVQAEHEESVHVHASIEGPTVIISTSDYIYSFNVLSVVINRDKLLVIQCEEAIVSLYKDELGNITNVLVAYFNGYNVNYYRNPNYIDI